MLNAKILNIILALSALCATNVFSASDDYLVESSLLQSQETNFWTYEIDDFNEVRIVYQIADSEKEAVSIGGTTDWSRSNGMDIVSRVDYDKYYINSIDPALYNILQRLTFGGAFLLEIDDIYSVYVGASGYTQGDNETLGKSGTFTASGRAAFGYEMGRLRIVGGAEITRDFGVRDYPSFYYEASDKLYLLPVGYINWEITDGVEINAGFPYNAVNLRPFDQMDVCGAYDLRSDYSEVAVRVRPFSNRFFVAARYIRDNTEDLKLHSGYMASRTYLRSGNYLSEERAIYSLDVGYYLPVLAADLIVAGRAGYSDGDGIIFRNDDNEETGRYESNDGFFGGMSITTDF